MTLQKVSPDSVSNKFELGQGRLKDHTPVAVVDIGSNSVRQVIYEGLNRAPSVIFNEKVLCGLGEGLVASDQLNESAIARALAAITRFVALQKQTNVGAVHIIATAAARDASNGADFIRQVENITGVPVEVLTGELEAKYSALGIKSGFYEPTGIAGDLGGGSLELVGVADKIANGITLPLGGLRLRELAGGDVSEAKKIAAEYVSASKIKWPDVKKRKFFAVGGTWRSLGKLHIANHKYILPTVHDYEIPAEEMKQFCKKVASDGFSNMRGLGAVSKNRRDLLPFGAVVLEEVINQYSPQIVALSSLGVREGFLYSRLTKQQQKQDSLLIGAKHLSVLRARSPRHCAELVEWTDRAFSELGLKESKQEKRYRTASCYLADIGWRAHPDFRAQQALETISNAGFVGINHEGRAYLALASLHRYQGLSAKVKTPPISSLASKSVIKNARILAAMFRVLYLFSASCPGVLPDLKIEKIDDKHANLTLPAKFKDLLGERPASRIRQLGRELGIQLNIVVVE